MNGTTMEQYRAWIADYERQRLAEIHVVGTTSEAERMTVSLRGSCATATERMVSAFPELRRVRGHRDGAPHWWCVAPDGAIVDPTVKQFADTSTGHYEEYTGPDPVGKCMNCGDYVWSAAFSTSACSDECARELEAYYGAVISATRANRSR